MKYDVFISYKRNGGAEMAELVRAELLKRKFRSSRLFMDTYNLGEGDYMSNIDAAINDSANIIVIVTRDCFVGINEDSNWIHEIKHALDSKKRLIPIYFDGITEIKSSEVPDIISTFPKENAVPYVHQYARASFDHLASLIEKEPRRLPLWGKVASGITAASIVAGGSLMLPRQHLKEGEVFIVESQSSKCYHMDKDCWTLKNSHKNLKVVTLEKAIEMGKRPCSKCCRDE